MATGSRPDSVFYGVYDKYVGEARTKPQVYGYWVFVLGLLAAVAAAGVTAIGLTVDVGVPAAALEEIVIVLAGCAGIGLLLGAVLQLPLRRRAVYVAVLASLVSLGALGFFFRLYPRGWALSNAPSRAVAVAYVGGLGIVAVVAALIPVVTGRRSLLLAEESAAELAWMDEDEDETRSTSAVMLGEATRDGVFAVFPSDGGWRWWFVEQAAVADSVRDYESQTKTEVALDGIREKVARASLLEVAHAAFRLYRTDDGRFRWTMVDDDGVTLADSDGTYETRREAEDAVNLLKEHGPNASLLDVDEGAFELYGDGDAWRWRLVDENRGTLAAGPSGHDERGAAEDALANARDHIPNAPLMDVEYVGFELVEDEETWRWRLVDAEDRPLLESAGEFDDRAACEASVGRLAEGAIDVPFLESGSPAYEVIAHDDGGWGWQLVDDEATVVATCEEPVPSEESGRSVVSRIKEVVDDASVIDLDDAAFEVYPEGDVWAWRLVTEDRETIAESPQSVTYEDEQAARRAVARVRDDIERVERIEFDSAAFHLYEAPDGGWNWRLVDADGSVVSDSGQEHASKEDAAAAMSTMKEHAPDADLVEIETATLELYEAEDAGNGPGTAGDDEGTWHWRLVDASGETLATSPGRYETGDAAREAMEALELLAPEAERRRMEAAAFQVYAGEGEDRRWRWRLIHPDGAIVARSDEGFAARDDAEAAAASVAEFAADATVHTIEDLAVRFRTAERPADDEDTSARTEWYWEVVDRDRNRLGSGTEVFDTRDAVAERARLFRDHAGAGSVFRVDPVAFRLEEDSGGPASEASSDSSDGGWHWRLVDFDRNTLAVGTQTYDDRADARADLARVQQLATEADLLDFDLAAFEVVEDGHGWRWRFIDTAGTVIGRSGPTYDSQREAQRALGHLRARLGDASLLDIDSPAFELHEAEDEEAAAGPGTPASAGPGTEWRWRLVDTDGSTVAESMRTYPTRREAREALDSLREFGADAATEVGV